MTEGSRTYAATLWPAWNARLKHQIAKIVNGVLLSPWCGAPPFSCRTPVATALPAKVWPQVDLFICEAQRRREETEGKRRISFSPRRLTKLRLGVAFPKFCSRAWTGARSIAPGEHRPITPSNALRSGHSFSGNGLAERFP